jgi:endonuclease/exonuclease/phosphatase family metal-dependent hydrolase
MRLATFNVENMFERPAAMNLPDWSDGRQVLEDFAVLNDLIAKANYTAAVKAKLITILARNTGLLTRGVSDFIRLREVRGKLVRKPAGQPHEIAVNGRDEWIGWFELVPAQVNATAILNTARIIKLVDADILCVIEADNRIALTRFNSTVLHQVGGSRYDHVLLIDGNDERGIDVGLMTRAGAPIESVVTHVHDTDATGVIFSRDCAEYRIALSTGEPLLLLVNHFKSKGFGSQGSSNAKRLRQATRVKAIYDTRRAGGVKLVAILGDFNETPDGAPLVPLLQAGSDLTDVMTHAAFVGDGRPGTHGNGTKSGKLDYILMSPELAARVTAGGIERRGVWGGTNGTLFPHLPEITGKIEAASDHAALFVDFT